ncbi:Imm61 family immunity protein (plasmid) [Mycobacterium sp. TJFP1]
MASTSLSPDLRAWAQAAGYTTLDDDADAIELRPLNGANTRYHLRPHGNQGVVLARTEPDTDPDEHIVLLIASPKVVEHHLYSLFGDDIREDLALPAVSRDPCMGRRRSSGAGRTGPPALLAHAGAPILRLETAARRLTRRTSTASQPGRSIQ